ncbi:MAG: universal stress protein [Balneolaceae bacterium]|nr:universal stress protein [Balneolaceae bacterium]
MDEEEEKRTVLFQKILVAIDTSKHSQAALEAAADLARTMEANIHGLFVHDEIWHRVSRLPSVSSVNTLTGQVTTFEDDTMEDKVRLLQNRLRQKLEQVSKQHELIHSWRSVKGKVYEKILEAAEEVDLITIGLKGASARRKRLGSSARRIIMEADKPVLILKEGLRLGSTITAVYDGSSESQKGIEIALNIAERNESTLTVLFVSKEPDSEDEQNNRLKNLLQDATVFVEIEQLDQPNVIRFLNAINQQKSGLLIAPKNQALLTKSLQILLNNINCPLLLMN